MVCASRFGMVLLSTCALIALAQRVLRLAAVVQLRYARMLLRLWSNCACLWVRTPVVLVSYRLLVARCAFVIFRFAICCLASPTRPVAAHP